MLATTKTFRAYSTSDSCRIIVDSCSSVTTQFAREQGVDIIEFPFVLAGEDLRCDQWESMSCTQFYDRMRKGDRAMTSAIPTGEFVELFRACAQEGVPTIYFSLTAGLSSSVRDAEQAAAQVRDEYPDFTIEVIDNRAPSLAALQIALEACHLRDAGQTVAQIAQWARKAPDRLHGYFTLDSLKWLALGGRIPKAAASISSVLDVKANLTYDLDGALGLTGICRGRKKAIKTIISQLAANYAGSSLLPLAIADADCPADADTLEEQVRAWFAGRDELCPPILRVKVDPTIGSHVGPGMLALTFWGTDRTQGWNGGKR